jgi:malonate transporter and related proteins
MSQVLSTVVPVFGLIALGFIAGRSGYLSEAAAKGLPEVVFKLVMPVLLFRTVGQATFPDIQVLALLGMFFGAAAGTWILATLLCLWPLQRPAGDGPGIAMGAAFSNSVMMGIPICISFFGTAAAPVLALIVAADTAIFWLWATLHLATVEGARSGSISGMLGVVLRRLMTNPIILGCAAGLAWQYSALQLPPLLDKIVSLIAGAAVPGALISLGLAVNSYGIRGQVSSVLAITISKLVIMPALAWLLWIFAFHVPPSAAAIILVLAAMPVGANAYLFAEAYNRAPAAVSGAIALSTLLAPLTVSALLLLIGAMGGSSP